MERLNSWQEGEAHQNRYKNMTVDQVRHRIGDDKWEEFCKFMVGQTMGVDEHGQSDIYECDVENFLRKPSKRFFD